MSYWQLGDKDRARLWYDEAVDWMENNKTQSDDYNPALLPANCPQPEIRDSERALRLAHQPVETDRNNGASWSVLG